MTLSEFKAWLDGYSESFSDGRPNADQWKKIQMKLNNLREANNPIYDYDKYRKVDGRPKYSLKGISGLEYLDKTVQG